MLNLQEFINKYTGVLCGNTDGNFGECVGLSMVWIENLGLNHFWGHAKDLFNNAPIDDYVKVENSPDIYPASGDIIVWDSSFGGGYGHTGVVVSSDPKTDSFMCFEQNFPTGYAPHIIKRTAWNGITGWLHPKVLDNMTTNTELQECLLKRDEYREQREHWKAELEKLKNKYEDLSDSNSKLKSTIISYEKTVLALEKDIDTAETAIEANKIEIESLTKARDKLQGDLDNCVKSLAYTQSLLNNESNLIDNISKWDLFVYIITGDKKWIK